MTQANDIVYADTASRTKHLTEQIELHRIIELVHDADLPGIGAQQRAALRRRIAALTSAFHGGNPIVFGWTRHPDSHEVQVFAGGRDTVAATGARVGMLLPPDSTGQPLPGRLPALMAPFSHWSRVAGLNDALLADDSDKDSAITLEDGLLGAWRGPFAWLVIAEPVTGTAIDAEISAVANTERNARTRKDSPEYAATADRAQQRHRELQRAKGTGLWRIHLLTGAQNSTDATRIAGLVCAGSDLHDLPYTLIPGEHTGSLADILETENADRHQYTSPILGSTQLLAAIAVPPLREIPGLRLISRPDFDVTAEHAAAGPAINIGTIVDRYGQPCGHADISHDSLLRHTFVTGATGGGKSQTIRNLLEQATSKGLPWMVVEPAKAEYRAMASRLAATPAEVIVIRPGDPDLLPAGINPLEPAWLPAGSGTARFPLQTHADMVRALFLASFDADEPFPQVLTAALTKCYEDAGWDLTLGEPRVRGTNPRYPTLGDLTQAAEQIVSQIGYAEDVTQNVTGFIRVRVESLRHGTTGRFLEGGHRLDFSKLMRRNVIFEIEDVGDDRDKAFLTGTVLIRLTQHLRLQQQQTQGPQPLRHLAVFEEAHRLLRHTNTTGAATHAVEMFASLLAEVRVYGQGIILAEQIPTKITPDAIKNTSVKIVHRLPARDDRDAVGATMNLSDAQSEHLVTLRPGHAALFSDGMDHPMLVKMHDRTAAEATFKPSLGSARKIVAARSVTCSSACRDQPCTLRQIRHAQQMLTAEPLLRLWAELSVLGHLTGWAMPVPLPQLLTRIQGMPARERDCALSHAVDNAVASRCRVSSTVDGQALASHVVDAMQASLRGERHCDAEEPRFLTASYRWALVWEQLQRYRSDGDLTVRHPYSRKWERVYQQPIPGDNALQQLANVQSWLADDQRDADTMRSVAFGDYQPSAIHVALGTPSWDHALASALSQFQSCTWPARYLGTPVEGREWIR